MSMISVDRRTQQEILMGAALGNVIALDHHINQRTFDIETRDGVEEDGMTVAELLTDAFEHEAEMEPCPLGLTALHLGCFYGRPGVVRYLLEKAKTLGRNIVDSVDPLGRTPLVLMTLWKHAGHSECQDLLLAAGASILTHNINESFSNTLVRNCDTVAIKKMIAHAKLQDTPRVKPLFTELNVRLLPPICDIVIGYTGESLTYDFVNAPDKTEAATTPLALAVLTSTTYPTNEYDEIVKLLLASKANPSELMEDPVTNQLYPSIPAFAQDIRASEAILKLLSTREEEE